MNLLTWVRRVISFVLLLLVVNIVTVALGRDESRLTVANLTDGYVHIFVEGQQFLYVAPNRSVTHVVRARPRMLVEVVYAPGQGLSGAFVDTVAVPFRSADTGCSCRSEDESYDCTYEPPSGGASRIEIFATDMEPSDQSGGG